MGKGVGVGWVVGMARYSRRARALEIAWVPAYAGMTEMGRYDGGGGGDGGVASGLVLGALGGGFPPAQE